MQSSVAEGVNVHITVFLGAPGSGKGTQAKRLSQEHGFQHFSTGDMLRAAIRAGSPLGVSAKACIDRGDLVPDDIMIALIEAALSPLPANTKVLLDGFPRTVRQAEALDTKTSTSVRCAIYFAVPEPVLISRLTGRRVCDTCGEPFHVEYRQPAKDGVCDRCGGALVQRKDDDASVVRHRLEVFSKQNQQLLAYYQSAAKLRQLSADKGVEDIQSDLIHMLH